MFHVKYTVKKKKSLQAFKAQQRRLCVKSFFWSSYVDDINCTLCRKTHTADRLYWSRFLQGRFPPKKTLCILPDVFRNLCCLVSLSCTDPTRRPTGAPKRCCWHDVCVVSVIHHLDLCERSNRKSISGAILRFTTVHWRSHSDPSQQDQTENRYLHGVPYVRLATLP